LLNLTRALLCRATEQRWRKPWVCAARLSKEGRVKTDLVLCFTVKLDFAGRNGQMRQGSCFLALLLFLLKFKKRDDFEYHSKLLSTFYCVRNNVFKQMRLSTDIQLPAWQNWKLKRPIKRSTLLHKTIFIEVRLLV
jgi:hypothetical protein